ncbi:MAG: hypothetical protein DIU68_004670 [Chloroflexota bacterium]|nr:MAG: hypothetical protein DIU68_03985 [Chloroflexota bacterium]
MRLGDLLLLLYAARDSFSSVDVAWDYTYDDAAMNVILERWMSQQPSGQFASLKATGSEGDAGSMTKITRRVWWRKPACWRDETGTTSRMVTVICDGAGATFALEANPSDAAGSGSGEQSPVRRLYSSSPPDIEARLDDVPLLDPSFLLTSHTLEPLEETVYLERQAIRVRATYRKGKNRIYEPLFWGTADEYELLVDQERGILLRYAAKLEQREIAVASVRHVAFDQPLSDDLFAAAI